jgi:two-component system OmpR family response regulator
MRILLIEHDTKSAKILQQYLRSYYVVDLVPTAQEALINIAAVSYDGIVLCLKLPDIPGEEVYKTLRERGVKTPVLIVSSKVDTAGKVSLIDMGVSDYITKPYELEEVRARICSVLRRECSCNEPGKITLGNLSLDPAARTVHRGKTPIDLRRKEFELLEYMMRNQRHTLTRAMILEHIWDSNENLWANVVDVHIKHLRDKIDRPFGSDLIRTVHGVGYKLETTERINLKQ